MTRHSTRASRVKVGPKMAIPWEMFSLTSSYREHTRMVSVVTDALTTFTTKNP